MEMFKFVAWRKLLPASKPLNLSDNKEPFQLLWPIMWKFIFLASDWSVIDFHDNEMDLTNAKMLTHISEKMIYWLTLTKALSCLVVQAEHLFEALLNNKTQGVTNDWQL